MRKFIIGLLAMPFIAMAQTGTTTTTEKTVVSVNRVFPKQDKIQAFEKALTAHAQKFHKGDYAWRVYTIESGPDAGGYHIVEGPSTWDGLDKRGDLGAAHTADWNTSIAPLLADRGSSSYSVYRDDLSTIALGEYTDKIAITHVYPKPGYQTEMEDAIKNLKKTWEASQQTIAVYESSSSGEPQFAFVTRYKQGLKERERNFRAPMKERYEKANGEGSWTKYQESLRTMIDRSWSELLSYKKELGSK
jgi:quinol monooxygenase YgiN